MAAQAYPTAYRTPATSRPQGRGFQNGPKVPANDNKPLRRLPLPANDNQPRQAPAPSTGQIAKGIARAVGLKMAPRIAARFNPWLNAALTLYDLYEAMETTPVPGQTGANGWYLTTGTTSATRPTASELDPSGLSGSAINRVKPSGSQNYGTVVTKSIQLFNDPRPAFARVQTHRLVYFNPVSPPSRNAVPLSYPASAQPAQLPNYRSKPDRSPLNTRALPFSLLPYRVPDWTIPNVQGQPAKSYPVLNPTPRNIVIRPGQYPTTAPATWKRTQPPRGTKETKLKASGATARFIAKLSAGANALTETGDLVDVFFDAVRFNPKSKADRIERARAARRGLAGRIEYVARNYRKIDVEQAVKNYITNELQDQAIGRTASAMNKANPGVSPVFTPWTKINKALGFITS